MTKYALISGGAGGIGTELCVAFAKRGYTVFALAPESHLFEVRAVQREHPNVIPYAFDITDLKQIEKAKEYIGSKTGGKLDILYNNAGISVAGPATEFEDEELPRLFQINVFGHMYMTKYFSEFIMNSKGSIIFTASIASRVPLTWVSLYNASKAAINAYALTLHTEMKPFGVRVHSVITGGVDTGICDANIKTSLLSDTKFDVDGVFESMNSSAMMSRNVNISPRKYAEGVVSDIVSRRDRFNLFRGAGAYLLFFFANHFPVWIVEWGISRHFKALKVWRNIRRRVREELRYNKKLN